MLKTLWKKSLKAPNYSDMFKMSVYEFIIYLLLEDLNLKKSFYLFTADFLQ